MNLKKQDKSIRAYMGQDTVFNGTLTFQGTVRIDGKFEGEVITDDTLIVGETGEVTAEITAGTVICKGRIKGVINAKQRIEVHAASQILGNIRTPSLQVEVGGIFDGNCDMSSSDKKILSLVKPDEKGKLSSA
ncbi:MAG: polymer-forming cytoskeletal protein [Nitrospinae bacterium]|nr:polymer-forming cytoskeletal protein [Nitrospinota bacterium]